MLRCAAMLSLSLFLCVFVSLSSAFVARAPLPIRNAHSSLGSFSAPVRPSFFCPRMAVDPAAVANLVEKIEKVADGGKAPKAAKKVLKALKKNSGAVMVATEFSRAESEPREGEHAVDFRTFSHSLRRNKAAALLVDCTHQTGLADLEAFVTEQATAKGNFPGPVPVIRSGSVTEVAHVAEAKAAGADGVMVDMTADDAPLLLAASSALGIEAVAVVANEDHVAAAAGAGCKLICASHALEPDDAAALLNDLGAECASLALIDARLDGGPDGLQAIFDKIKEEKLDESEAPKLKVVTRGLALREAKCNGLLLSAACSAADDKSEVGFHNFLLESLQSKKSTTFAKMAKIKNPLGTGRPPAKLEGFTTILEGSV